MDFRFSRRIGIAIAGALLGTSMLAAPIAATTVGDTEGCTPGYWKNHTDSWQEAAPGQSVKSIFSGVLPAFPGLADESLLAALDGGGGSGPLGGAKILLRAATAAWLNAAYDPLDFPWQRFGNQFRPPLVPTVNAALQSDRATMIALAARLDNDNNLGCPLN